MLEPFGISNCSRFCYPNNNLNLKSVAEADVLLIIYDECFLKQIPQYYFGKSSSLWLIVTFFYEICLWNLNGIAAPNYTKLSLLTAYNLVHSLISFVFQRHISTLKLYLMTHVWSCQEYNLFHFDHPSKN